MKILFLFFNCSDFVHVLCYEIKNKNTIKSKKFHIHLINKLVVNSVEKMSLLLSKLKYRQNDYKSN